MAQEKKGKGRQEINSRCSDQGSPCTVFQGGGEKGISIPQRVYPIPSWFTSPFFLHSRSSPPDMHFRLPSQGWILRVTTIANSKFENRTRVDGAMGKSKPKCGAHGDKFGSLTNWHARPRRQENQENKKKKKKKKKKRGRLRGRALSQCMYVWA
jgi:hypothetical protein